MAQRFFLFVSFLLVFGRCTPGAPPLATPRFQPTETVIIEPPAPTLAPAPIETPDPRTPTMLPQADAQATMSARATASPFPTAQPAVVQAGTPYRVEVKRGGLFMQVELAQDTLMAGESAQAHITLQNTGPDTIRVTGDIASVFRVILLDEQGHEPAPFPWQPMSMPGQPRGMEIKAGASYSETVAFQIPPAELLQDHTLVLWGIARFSRTAPENGDGPDNLWLQTEAGPLVLKVTPPAADKQAVADLALDRDGWTLRVTDRQGNALHPTWGYMEAQSGYGAMTWHLPPSADGTWKQQWDQDFHKGTAVAMRAWVGSSGYVVATSSGTLPGTGDPVEFVAPFVARILTFSTLAEAETELGVPIRVPHELPDGAVLDAVQVEAFPNDRQRRTKTTQLYRIGDAYWLELIQRNETTRYDSAGWGEARFAADAAQVDVNGTTGYLVTRLGWRVLDWKRDDVGFELRVPVERMSAQELLALAQSVEP